MSDGAIEGRIFVGGLDHDCDEAALDKAFSMFGEINQILIMRDRETDRSRGFGFISFDSQDAADDARNRMHGVEIMGRCVTVRKAEKQAAISDRGEFKGGRRGGFRGGRGGGDHYEGRSRSDYNPRGRGRGSHYGNRRYSNEGSSRDYDSRGSSRRGGFGNSRMSDRDGGRNTSYENRRGSYDNSRQTDYGEMQLSDEYDDVGRGAPNHKYGNSRKSYNSDRYTDSSKGMSRGYDNGSMQYRGGYNQSGGSRYESDSRGRSRSPIVRYVFREESPPPSKSFGREYSPVRRPAVREYSPMPNGKSMSKSYDQDRREMFREFSPPRGRVPIQRDISPDVYAPPPKIRGRAGSPQSTRGRFRDVSPDEYIRTKGRASSPRERSSYMNSRPIGALSKNSMPPRKEYSSRTQNFSARGDRYTDSGGRGGHIGRSSGGMNRGAGTC